jgi:putative membrane protein
MDNSTPTDPRVFFAAERTFLAWIRTGLALMGFGFVVARFGIFLQQIMLDRGNLPVKSSGVSVGLGVCLIAIGVAVNLASAWRHVRLVQTLKKGELLPVRPSMLAIALALALALIGLIMSFYVVHMRDVAQPTIPKGQTMQTQNDSGIINRLGGGSAC